MIIDLRRCVGCGACVDACKQENNVPIGKFRTWVKLVEKGKYPDVRKYPFPIICNHCENPICVRNCPVKASYQREDGIVLVDFDRCIGCRYCISSCPYDVRFANPFRKTADKCTFCVHRVQRGLQPACVVTCMTRARIFGDLNDPDSEVSKIIATQPVRVLKPEANTDPRVYYIASDMLTIDAGRQDPKYMEHYRRKVRDELEVSDEYIKEMHDILDGRSNADRRYDYRIEKNKPLKEVYFR